MMRLHGLSKSWWLGVAVLVLAAGSVSAAAAGTDAQGWRPLGAMEETVAGWGDNQAGQGTVPAGLKGVVAVAAGENHTVALKGDGTVVPWGSNTRGQTNVPPGLANVVAISAGGDHTVALKADGTVVAWGDDSCGQTDVPPGLANVVAIAAGEDHTVALKADGTVVAWGDDSYGQTDVPTSATGVMAVAAGGGFTVALRANGTVVAWGDDAYGQTNVPSGLTGVAAVAAGESFAVAAKADGTAAAWGDDSFGQRDVPPHLRAVAAVAAGGSHGAALRGIGVFPATLASGTPGTPYGAVTFTQAGGSGAVRWAASGTLPTGLAFADNKDGTATLAGTPTQTGNFAFTVTATDSRGHAGSRRYVLSLGLQPMICAGCEPPCTLGITLSQYPLSGTAGTFSSWSFRASGGNGYYQFHCCPR